MLAWKKRVARTDADSPPRDHSTHGSWDLIYVSRLIEQLTAIYADQKATEEQLKDELQGIPEHERSSARNLMHYLALRARDVRSLQGARASMGLYSHGRAEGDIMHNVLLLLKHLHHLIP